MPEITQEQYDELIKQISILKFQQQEHQDTLESGLTSRNFASFRNTYVINAQDSLDADYPMYVHFNIIKEMIKIVSVKVSFWILNYRAYSKGAASGGGQTTSSKTTPSGGSATSGATNAYGIFDLAYDDWVYITNVGDENKNGYLSQKHGDIQIVSAAHTHLTPDHTHPAHTHTVSDHTHDAVYGIFEEDTSPTIKFYISENEGVSYNDTFFGGYTTKKADLEITSLLTGAGSKLIKFESDLRTRLSVQIEIKLDIKAR